MGKVLCEGNFFNPTKGNISFIQMLDEIFSYIKEEPKYDYEIIVGCDSSSAEEPSFPIAIVILRKGAGGRFFLKKVKYHNRKFYNLHERILEEVWLSCRLALELRDAMNKKVNKMSNSLNYEFEYIRADVGINRPTKDMIKEVVGLIKGNGFEAKIKPEAYVASIVADRFS